MLIIVAARNDMSARELAARWSAQDAVVLTPAGLSQRGWRHQLGSPENSAAVVGGRVVAPGQITGVLTRTWGVDTDELTHIIPEDRQYVTMEMTAFLLSWLTSLDCPVVNRPTPSCLSGPGWRNEQWVRRAAQLSIPVRSVTRRTVLGQEPAAAHFYQNTVAVSIVGTRSFGEADERLHLHARLLADSAGVELLVAYFSSAQADAELVGASVWVDVRVPEIADAILEYLKGGHQT